METGSVLELRGITKAFPGVRAVDGVDLDLNAGEIHGLVGENGAGKSTLANIAFGTLVPDAGTVRARGSVGLVHQHFEIAGRMRVWENVLLGREPRKGFFIDAAGARDRVRTLAQSNGLEIDPDAIVEELPIALQQRVELLRELERSPAVLLLDEPTAALAPPEIHMLFTALQGLAQRGTAILVVTHKLNEVLAYCKRVTVMRHGRIVARYRTADTSADEIARAMVGGTLPVVAARVATVPEPRFQCEHLHAGSGPGAISDVSFEVRSGEIVGVAGVEGNGQTALADAIAGVIPYTGRLITGNDPQTAGARVIPQDRLREGLVLQWPVVENAILGRQHSGRLRRGAMLDRAAARADAQAIVRNFDVRAASLDVPVRTLSGGNQQKIVVGRALLGEPRFVLAYQPTRGIDVGAGALVHSRLIEARNSGCAILLISFDLDEILTLADRILVMYRGRIVSEQGAVQARREEIGRAFLGESAG